MMKSVPVRIRGRTGQLEDEPDKGKWVYQISFWSNDGEEEIYEPTLFGPYESEWEAKAVGLEKIELVVKSLQEAFGGKPTGQVLDLQDNAKLKNLKELVRH